MTQAIVAGSGLAIKSINTEPTRNAANRSMTFIEVALTIATTHFRLEAHKHLCVLDEAIILVPLSFRLR